MILVMSGLLDSRLEFFMIIKSWYLSVDEVALAQQMEGKNPGEIKLLDYNGDGVISPDDRHVVGTDIPDFYGGLTTNFNYKIGI